MNKQPLLSSAPFISQWVCYSFSIFSGKNKTRGPMGHDKQPMRILIGINNSTHSLMSTSLLWKIQVMSLEKQFICQYTYDMSYVICSYYLLFHIGVLQPILRIWQDNMLEHLNLMSFGLHEVFSFTLSPKQSVPAVKGTMVYDQEPEAKQRGYIFLKIEAVCFDTQLTYPTFPCS